MCISRCCCVLWFMSPWTFAEILPKNWWKHFNKSGWLRKSSRKTEKLQCALCRIGYVKMWTKSFDALFLFPPAGKIINNKAQKIQKYKNETASSDRIAWVWWVAVATSPNSFLKKAFWVLRFDSCWYNPLKSQIKTNKNKVPSEVDDQHWSQ